MWTVSDDFNTEDNVGNLNNFDAGNYYDKEGWRLTKNMALCNKSDQKYQQTYDLKNFVKKDYDIGIPNNTGLNKKFNGLGLTTLEKNTETILYAEDLTTTETYRYTTEIIDDSKALLETFSYNADDFYLDEKVSNKPVHFHRIRAGGLLKFKIGPCNGKISIGIYNSKKSGLLYQSKDVILPGKEEEFIISTYEEGLTPIADFLQIEGTGEFSYSIYYKQQYKNLYCNYFGPTCKYNLNNKGFDVIYVGRCIDTNGESTITLEPKNSNETFYNIGIAISVGNYTIDTMKIDTNEKSIKIDLSYISNMMALYNAPISIFVFSLYGSSLQDEVINTLIGPLPTTGYSLYPEFNVIISNNFINNENDSFITLEGYKDAADFELTKAHSSKLILKTEEHNVPFPLRINYLPLEGGSIKKTDNLPESGVVYADDNSFTFINPKGRHYTSGYFYPIGNWEYKGAIDVKITAHCPNSETVNIYTDNNTTKSEESIVKVSAFNAKISQRVKNGETFTFKIDEEKFEYFAIECGVNCSYDIDYPGEYTGVGHYIRGKKVSSNSRARTAVDIFYDVETNNAFTEYKGSSLSTSILDRDYAFVATSNGDLDVKYSGTGKLQVFISGYNVTDKLPIKNVLLGNVILIRVVDDKTDGYVYFNRTGKNFEGQLTYNFTGTSAPMKGCTISDDLLKLSWNEQLDYIIEEAKLWVKENDISDYAFPILIDDVGNDTEKVKSALTALNNSGLKLDLFLRTSGNFAFKNYTMQNLISLVLNSSNQDLSEMFLNHKSIKAATIIGSNNYNKTFKDCSSLQALSIYNAVNSDFTEIAKNSGVYFINFYNIDGGNFSNGFENCKNIFNFILEMTGNRTVDLTSVCENSNLSSLYLKFANNNLIFNSSFANCTNLNNIGIERPIDSDGMIIDAYRAFDNCYKAVKSHDIIKNFFGKQYDKYLENDDKFKTAFINCPYNGTVLQDYMSYTDQKAVNFNPADLMYNVLHYSALSMDPGYENINHDKKISDDYLNRYTIKVVSHQHNESSSASYVSINGKNIITATNRGTHICVLDPTTRELKYNDWTDTYSYEIKDTPIMDIWNAAYDIATYQDIIIILTYDACSFTQSLIEELYKIGASDKLKECEKERFAYALIGKKELNKGKGFDASGEKETFAETTAHFDESGLICSTWKSDDINPIKSKRFYSENSHLNDNYNLEVYDYDFWKWYFLFKNMKSLYDSCGFKEINKEPPNFNLCLSINGSDEQINPNSASSFSAQYRRAGANDFIYHLAQIENTSKSKISINNILSGIDNLHCIECNFKNIDDISGAFSGCSFVEHATFNFDGIINASRAFEDCVNLKSIDITSNSVIDGSYMFKGCTNLTQYDISKMTVLKDATSMFEGCTSITGKFYDKTTHIPDSIEIARRMFYGCGITEIEGKWLPPNSSYNMQNYTETEFSHITKDWENNLVKEDGWTFPENLTDAYQMFANNPITKVSFLETVKKANNSYLFQNCTKLTEFIYDYLNIDTAVESKYTGIFNNCALSAENRIWLPVSISSNFNLKATDVAAEPNSPPIEFWVDDHWCEVDDSGFIDYQHIRRKAYQDVLAKTYKDIVIKYWSHVHIHSAEMRGYNEIHDAKVWYDPESYSNEISYYTNNSKKEPKPYDYNRKH